MRNFEIELQNNYLHSHIIVLVLGHRVNAPRFGRQNVHRIFTSEVFQSLDNGSERRYANVSCLAYDLQTN